MPQAQAAEGGAGAACPPAAQHDAVVAPQQPQGGEPGALGRDHAGGGQVEHALGVAVDLDQDDVAASVDAIEGVDVMGAGMAGAHGGGEGVGTQGAVGQGEGDGGRLAHEQQG